MYFVWCSNNTNLISTDCQLNFKTKQSCTAPEAGIKGSCFYLRQNKNFVIVHDGVQPVSNGDDSAVTELSLDCVLE